MSEKNISFFATTKGEREREKKLRGNFYYAIKNMTLFSLLASRLYDVGKAGGE